MRYLDREPVEGDRVHVEYDATVTKPIVAPHFWYGVRVNLPNGTPGETHVPRTATVRVIAPEPAVGDVVTEDMGEWPVGTIVERSASEGLAVAVWGGAGWATSTGDVFSTGWLVERGNWRIVRIGGAA